MGDLSIFVMLYDSLFKRKDWAKMGLIISNHLACFLAIYALRKIALNRIHFGLTFSIQSQLKKLSHYTLQNDLICKLFRNENYLQKLFR